MDQGARDTHKSSEEQTQKPAEQEQKVTAEGKVKKVRKMSKNKLKLISATLVNAKQVYTKILKRTQYNGRSVQISPIKKRLQQALSLHDSIKSGTDEKLDKETIVFAPEGLQDGQQMDLVKEEVIKNDGLKKRINAGRWKRSKFTRLLHDNFQESYGVPVTAGVLSQPTRSRSAYSRQSTIPLHSAFVVKILSKYQQEQFIPRLQESLQPKIKDVTPAKPQIKQSFVRPQTSCHCHEHQKPLQTMKDRPKTSTEQHNSMALRAAASTTIQSVTNTSQNQHQHQRPQQAYDEFVRRYATPVRSHFQTLESSLPGRKTSLSVFNQNSQTKQPASTRNSDITTLESKTVVHHPYSSLASNRSVTYARPANDQTTITYGVSTTMPPKFVQSPSPFRQRKEFAVNKWREQVWTSVRVPAASEVNV